MLVYLSLYALLVYIRQMYHIIEFGDGMPVLFIYTVHEVDDDVALASAVAAVPALLFLPARR